MKYLEDSIGTHFSKYQSGYMKDPLLTSNINNKSITRYFEDSISKHRLDDTKNPVTI